jgi:hypothetical protein
MRQPAHILAILPLRVTGYDSYCRFGAEVGVGDVVGFECVIGTGEITNTGSVVRPVREHPPDELPCLIFGGSERAHTKPQ